MSNGFFIGGFGGEGGKSGGNGGSIIIKDDDVMASVPLDFYIDNHDDVYVGGKNNNSILVYWEKDGMYARKVV